MPVCGILLAFFLQLVLVGDSMAGKTAFLLRFSDNVVHNETDQRSETDGVDFRMKTAVFKSKILKVNILPCSCLALSGPALSTPPCTCRAYPLSCPLSIHTDLHAVC